MKRVIYVSKTDYRMTDDELDALLLHVWQRNKIEGISGLLVYKAQSFLQVIEGQDASVDRVVERVLQDPRHHDITILSNCTAGGPDQRVFPGWCMGFRRTDTAAGHPAWFSLTRRALEQRLSPMAGERLLMLLRGDCPQRRPAQAVAA